MAERASAPPPDLSAAIMAVGLAASISAHQRIAGETLPPELMRIAAGLMAEALAKAVSYAKRALSPRTEKIYADNWNVFEA